MPLWSLVSRVPWRQVVRYAPHVLDHTERLLDFVRSSRARSVHPDATADPALDDLAGRVARIEQAQVEQTELLAQVAGQLEKLTGVVRVLSARVTLALWLAAAALMLALVSLVIRLL